jgi:hypothetical protein
MKTHGGKRKGAGRPKMDNSKKKEATVVMRIPKSKVELVKLIKETETYDTFRHHDRLTLFFNINPSTKQF